MNRALRIGDHVEFRNTESANAFCASGAYPELAGLDGGSQLWDESEKGAAGKNIIVTGRHNGITPERRQLTISGDDDVVPGERVERPCLAIWLSWTGRYALAFASDLRLDNRARRNRAGRSR